MSADQTRAERETPIQRAVEMLTVAAQWIRESGCSERLIHYDEADCDGSCVADDCESAALTLHDTAAPDLRAQIEALVQQMRQRVNILSADGIYSVADELDQWSERLSALLPASGKE